jgi:hypothetical protein
MAAEPLKDRHTQPSTLQLLSSAVRSNHLTPLGKPPSIVRICADEQ